MDRLREAFEHALADNGAIDAAIAVAESCLGGGDDIVASAYLGSLNAMKAGAATLPWIKLRHANIAAELLDRAYERRNEIGCAPAGGADVPGDLVILLLRGIAYASFPAFLGRGAAARDSLEEAVGNPSFADVPAAYRSLALSHLAELDANAGGSPAAGRTMDPVPRSGGG